MGYQLFVFLVAITVAINAIEVKESDIKPQIPEALSIDENVNQTKLSGKSLSGKMMISSMQPMMGAGGYIPPPISPYYSPHSYPMGAGFPGAGFPGAGFPGAGFPGAGFPGAGFPGAGFPGAGFPGAGFPGAGFPGAPYPPMTPPYYNQPYGYPHSNYLQTYDMFQARSKRQ